jgi:hypothetical protein
MAKARSWFVEFKEIEMLIKGGNVGLRMVEKSNKRQDSIYILRDEVAWLVGVVEEVVDVDTPVVFWNQSRAGCPRVVVQRRSNRHGRFIIMEEFEGRTRRGSVLIPEGRYGQGWTRLLSELKIARTTMWKGREFRESKAVEKGLDKRTFAEVVGQPKIPEKEIFGNSEQYQTRPATTKMLENETCGVCAKHQTRPMNTEPPKHVYPGGRTLTHTQTRPVINMGKKQIQLGSSQETEEAGGHHGVAPVKCQVQLAEKRVGATPVACGLHEALKNPAISGVAAQKGEWESERSGLPSLQARAELQEVLKYLTDIRGQVDLGLKRVEVAIQYLENEGMGRELMGRSRSSEVGGWAKPKKKIFKQKTQIQAGLLGSKPNKAPVLDAQAGQEPTGKAQSRALSKRPAEQLRMVGESSMMGAARESGCIPMKNAGHTSGELLKGVGAGAPDMPKETEGADDLVRATGFGGGRPATQLSSVPESADQLGVGAGAPDMTKETERDDDLVGATGLGGGRPATQLSSIPESADQLGGESVAPKKITQGSESSEMLFSSIPESAPPEKCSKSVSEYSDSAGDVGRDDTVQVKQAKQIKVFQRRESPLAKVPKSWVAERISWNGGRDEVVATEDSSGKNDSDWLDSEELAVNRFSLLDEDEDLGDLGGMGSQEEDLGSPVSKTLNLVWNVRGTAGISCDGQEEKLKEVFGQIVVDKFGEGTSVATGEAADDFLGMGDVNGTYEA